MSRNKILTREDFKSYCLRALGNGVIDINVSDDQIEDRIDEAIQFAQEFIYEGSYKNYIQHTIDDTDRANEYINLPDEILSVNQVFYNTTFIGNSLNNVFKLSTISLVNNLNAPTNTISNFYFAKLNLATLNKNLNAYNPIRFNYSIGKLYLDMSWESNFFKDDNILIDCYTSIDPETNTRLWDNLFLKRYAIALIQKQWGNNLKKYNGISLPGNTTLNADSMINSANEELQKVKEEIVNFEMMPNIIVA